MYSLGIDIGSSSVKVSVISVETGNVVAAAQSPAEEMPIASAQVGWAEQHPDLWWEHLQKALGKALCSVQNAELIKTIGISYQMHGLVCLDREGKVLRPAIIWCDSRAVGIGDRALADIGIETCMKHSLNAPANFTASKLAWVKENEPTVYERIYKFMLPGDYIAYRLTGEMCTTISGLSEMMLWDFSNNSPAQYLLDYYGIDKDLLPALVPTFGNQGTVRDSVAEALGLPNGITIKYRAGDQPNNALSLGVFNPGEVAATAGTSGVVYGVSDVVRSDIKGRIGTFAHVNHTEDVTRLGLLLCINGTGSLNAYMRREIALAGTSYSEMNAQAIATPIGAEGLCILPFGNGAERMLENKDTGASIHGLRFFTHTRAHLFRAAQEGIAYSFYHGIRIMQECGCNVSNIRAGKANLFLSPLFAEAVSNLAGVSIDLYDTDGAAGAARAAVGIEYTRPNILQTITPETNKQQQYADGYQHWLSYLQS